MHTTHINSSRHIYTHVTSKNKNSNERGPTKKQKTSAEFLRSPEETRLIMHVGVYSSFI